MRHPAPAAVDPGDGRVDGGATQLLGTADDVVVAGKIGRTPEAVRCRRTRESIPTFRDRRSGR